MPKDDTFTAAERQAMKDRAKELRSAPGAEQAERDTIDAIEKMPESERAIALSFHELVGRAAPDLAPRTWYGMPAYATPGKKGKVVCFFKGATKGESRYSEVGFTDLAEIDAGSMWPTAFAITRWTAAHEKTLRDLLAKAVHGLGD